MEVWKDIPGYEGFYQISSEGRVKGVKDREVVRSDGVVKHLKEQILKQKIIQGRVAMPSGYVIGLHKDNAIKYVFVHRLVATAFLGEPPDKTYTVNHKDGNRLNNKVENLEWLTMKENIRYGFKVGQFNKNMKPVVLISDKGERYYFKSSKECSIFLGKKETYISELVFRNSQFAISSDGVKYEVFRTNEKC